MGNFGSFQYQQREPSAAPTSSFARPIRPFAPVSSPTSQSVPPGHTVRYGHSLDRISIFPPTTDSAGRKLEAVPQEGEVVQGIFKPTHNRENNTGLPDNLKAGIEILSGMSMDDVQIHYHSSKPAQVQALAYTQGTDIYVGPAQENHLAHEAWHVVQQNQGRVKPTLQAKGMLINDDQRLEREAEAMGDKAGQIGRASLQRNGGIDAGAVEKFSSLNPFTPQTCMVGQRQAKADPAGRGVIQLYRMVKGWKISTNDVYKIDTSHPEELHVLRGHPGPNPADQFTLSRTTGDGYNVYIFSGNFQNDCLAFAEYLSTGEYSSKSAFRSKGDRPKGSDRLFGVSDKQNMDIAESKSQFSKGEEADPDIGEAFVTIRRMIEAGKCPYHVAMVVASDGNDRISCEADAGSAMNAPVFDMYMLPEKGKPKSSQAVVAKGFHKTYSPYYRTKKPKPIAPITGVLTPRISL